MRCLSSAVHYGIALLWASLAAPPLAAAQSQDVYDPFQLRTPHEWIRSDPAGPVESFRIDRRELGERLGRPIAGDPVLEYSRTYDRAGCLIEEAVPLGSPEAEDRVVSRTRYTYDDAGRLIEQSKYFDDAEQWRQTFQYGPEGRRISSMSYSADRPERASSRREYEYDDQGRLVALRDINGLGAASFTMTKRYDEAGQVVEESTSDNEGRGSVRSYSYDAERRLVQERMATAVYEEHTVYTYKGDIVEKQLVVGDSLGRLEVTSYDGQERVVRVEGFDAGGAGRQWMVCSYDRDQAGNVVKGELWFREFDRSLVEREPVPESIVVDARRAVFEVEYDDHDNWTRYTILNEVSELGEVRLRPVRRYERTIRYYD